MRNEVIKQAFKLGNSAGVLLPNEWRGRKVSIKLIEKSITQEIFEILEDHDLLKNTIGIFLAGSYARGEETEDSDIDILIVTDNINKQIKEGKYEITLTTKDRLENSLKKSLYIISLIKESKAILNENLLNEYKGKITTFHLKEQIDEIKRIIRINKTILELDEETKDKFVMDGTLYSLVLRLRETYLIECLINNKIPTKKGFLNIIKKVATEESYNAYLRVKNNQKDKQVIPIEEAKSLLEELKKRTNSLEHEKKKQKTKKGN